MRDDDDDSPAPSLLLARSENAHREHHQHQHNKLHKRQTDEVTTIASASVVTEVIQTVSVVAQIDVDSNGNTFSVSTVPADATSNGSQVVLTDSSSSTSATTTAATPSSSNPASAASSTLADDASETNSSSLISQSSGQSATTASTSTPSTHATFAPLIGSSNSTTLISSSSSLSHTFTNSSSLSSSRSSLTYLTFPSSSLSSSTSSEEFSSITSTSSNTFTSTSFQSTSTGSAGVLAGGTGVTPGTATSSAVSSGNGTDSNSGSPVSTSAVVGSVVGSIAGVAVLALLVLFFVKWRKHRNGTLLSLGSGRDGAGDGADIVMGGPPSQPAGGMTERRSFAYAVPAALASLTGYKRSSQKTERTMSSTAGSEQGFYRVSGRKLPSVLQTGGDGYGGMPDNTISGSSFYRDSHGFYGGPGTPTFPTMETQRESGQIGTPVMRPSPARTPVTEQGPFSLVPSPLDPLPPRPDLLGRSHPSQDGSHASRFTEEV